MPDAPELRRLGTRPHLERGAANAVRNCLRVGPRDVVTLICDERGMTVAAALLAAVDAEGARVRAFILERHAQRPMTELPQAVVKALSDSTVSIYVVHPLPGEFPHRRQLVGFVQPLRLRHAHMIDVTEDVMVQGMLSDYRHVSRLNKVVIEILGRASRIRVTSRAGTELDVTLDPSEPWEESAGIIEPGTWANLPNGEINTTPASVDGVFVADARAPIDEEIDPFELARRPLRLEIRHGRLATVSGGPAGLAERVQRFLSAAPNLDRVGQFAVGTNFDLRMPIGNPTQDLFVPGAYFSFGRLAAAGGATWTASTQVPFTARRTTLEVDGRVIIRSGQYETAILAEAGAL